MFNFLVRLGFHEVLLCFRSNLMETKFFYVMIFYVMICFIVFYRVLPFYVMIFYVIICCVFVQTSWKPSLTRKLNIFYPNLFSRV